MQTARHTPLIRRAAGPRARGGFTLVEMLVAVGLVMLMMLLFTEVFQIATGSLRRQRGLAENDQRSRMLSILVKGDLDKRTFRLVLPFAPGEDPDTSPFPFADREGYLYIGENNPLSDADDVLQFTANANITRRSHDTSPFFGRAFLLGGDIANHPNQPEFDDGMAQLNDAGRSRLAEVSYFVRDRRLIRRVLLIRQPLREQYEVQPQSGSEGDDQNFFDQSEPPDPNGDVRYWGSFWRDFDYSAHFTIDGPRFHGALNLENRGVANTPFPLAHPFYRFGHHHDTGQPVEFAANGFIGRFTHEETSHWNFVYPSRIDDQQTIRFLDANDPYPTVRNDLQLTPSGAVSPYHDDPDARIGEDVLLSNVLGFDVKVWDDILGEFVDVGHDRPYVNGVPGVYHQDRNMHWQFGIAYGPQGDQSRIYDTWHREINFSEGPEAPPPYDPPPFGWEFDEDGIRDISDLGNPFSDDVAFPLRAIQITITYIDESSEQMRNMTLVHSFVD